jgi:hypothetical protein
MGKDPNGQLYETGRSVSSRIQGEGGKQVLASITLQKIECLASKLVFGPKGLVLGSSMALIPTETTQIFPQREKSTDSNYNVIIQKLNHRIIIYQLLS